MACISIDKWQVLLTALVFISARRASTLQADNAGSSDRLSEGDAVTLSDIRRDIGPSLECSARLDDLAFSLARISRCLVGASRPLRACTKCYKLRENVELAYAALITDHSNQSECGHEMLDWDTVQLVSQSYNYYQQLMRTSRCDTCTRRLPSGIYQLLPVVARATAAYNSTMDCFMVRFPAEKIINASDTMCHFCNDTWININAEMKRIIKNPNDWQACRDIMDMANSTWHVWKAHECEPPRTHILIQLGIVIGIFSISVLYYHLM